MKKQVSVLRKSGFMRVASAILALLITITLPGCQQEDLTMDDLALKSAAIPELTLTYPDEACPGEDFTIVFSSNCGKVMIERGYINGDPIVDDQGFTVGYEKIYAGLTCDTEFLQWEAIGNDEFLSCTGSTITGNWQEVGSYVYRAKLNQKAVKKSGCPDCADFKGNRFECFMVTVTECGSGTFTDDRDGHKYKWVKIGDQVWMAENLAFKTATGSWAINNDESNVAIYGRLYNWTTAMTVCPAGWHLPSKDEWPVLTDFLGGFHVAGGKMKTTGTIEAGTGLWHNPNTEATNVSGFSALPGGMRNGSYFNEVGYVGYWWSSSETSVSQAMGQWLHYELAEAPMFYFRKVLGISVRCVRD